MNKDVSVYKVVVGTQGFVPTDAFWVAVEDFDGAVAKARKIISERGYEPPIDITEITRVVEELL